MVLNSSNFVLKMLDTLKTSELELM